MVHISKFTQATRRMKLPPRMTKVIQMTMIMLNDLPAHKMFFPYLKMTKLHLAFVINLYTIFGYTTI